MKILIVRLGAIGDVLHTLPALAALRRSMPEARIAWAVEKGGAARLLEDNPCIDDLIELDLRGWRKDPTKTGNLRAVRDAVSRLRAARFDLSLDFQGLLKSAMIPWISRVPRRIGFSREGLREPASAFLLTEQAPADETGHVIRKNLQLIAHLGCDISGEYEFPIALGADDLNFAQSVASKYDGRFAILNPGGGWPTKLWGTDGFAVIADRLKTAYGIRSVVTFGPGEEAIAEEIASQSRTGAADLLKSDLKQFFALARKTSLFIGGDTGPMHLAAAAGAPIVSIFGPTSSQRNGPFNKDDVVIERWDLDCRTDCYRRSCSHTSCMKIPADTVWQGVVKRLQILPTSTPAGADAGGFLTNKNG